MLFPQFKACPVTRVHINLPKLVAIPINIHRPIPDGFAVKQVRIIKKADRWYVNINIQCDVNVPDPMPHGHPIGAECWRGNLPPPNLLCERRETEKQT